jgi:hypothetical protein
LFISPFGRPKILPVAPVVFNGRKVFFRGLMLWQWQGLMRYHPRV